MPGWRSPRRIGWLPKIHNARFIPMFAIAMPPTRSPTMVAGSPTPLATTPTSVSVKPMSKPAVTFQNPKPDAMRELLRQIRDYAAGHPLPQGFDVSCNLLLGLC